MNSSLPISYIKATIYSTISATLAFFSGFWLSKMQGGEAGKIFLFAIVGILLWLSVGMLRQYVFWNFKYAELSILLDTLLITIPIAMVLGGISKGIVLAWAVLLVFLIGAFLDGRKELQNAIRIRPTKAGRGASRYLVLGTNLFLAIIIVLQLKAGGVAVSKPILKGFFGGAAPFVSHYVPEFSLDMQTDAFLESLARSQTPPGTSPSVVAQAKDQLIAAIEENGHIVLDPHKPLIDSLHDGINSRLDMLAPRQRLVTFLIIGGFIFIVLASLGFIVREIILFVSFVLYEILFAANFFKIKLESQNKETVEI